MFGMKGRKNSRERKNALRKTESGVRIAGKIFARCKTVNCCYGREKVSPFIYILILFYSLTPQVARMFGISESHSSRFYLKTGTN